MAVKLFFEDLTPGMAAKLVTRYHNKKHSMTKAGRVTKDSHGARLPRESWSHLSMEPAPTTGEE